MPSHNRYPESDLETALQEENIYHADSSSRLSHKLVGKDHPAIVFPTPPGTPNWISKKRHLTMSLDSDDSEDTAPTALSIAPLQHVENFEGKEGYNQLDIDDPTSFDLVDQSVPQERKYSLENRAELLFSKQHLEAIFADPRLFLKFTTFLSKHRPQSIPLLIYYLDASKALKAIAYSNAIADGLEEVSFADFTASPPRNSINATLQDKADRTFAMLAQEDLPAYVTHVLVDIVSTSIHRKITGTMAPQLRQASEGLAEVFCMSDMSKPDQPIVFSSEEFHRTTQYGLDYAIGKNCRFLQGPRSSPFSVKRLREAIRNRREHQETFLNYRRDGSPFMNLLTMAPLLDNQGKVRYYIGAQVDVSGLVKDCTNLEAFEKLVLEQQAIENGNILPRKEKKDEFQSLSEMFNQSELETVRLHGGSMHSEQHELDDSISVRASNRPRLLIREPSGEDFDEGNPQDIRAASRTAAPDVPSPLSGKLPGVFANYLILRPHPSLRITFTSPSLRVPGLLQSPFLSRIGGSGRVREELALALSEGRNVTAKIRWLKERFDDAIDENDGYGVHSQPAGKSRWIHCTPLVGANRAVGAWMVLMIDGDDYGQQNKQAEGPRTGAVSPSWGRRPRDQLKSRPSDNSYIGNTINGVNHAKLRSSNRNTQQSGVAPSYDNNSEWDLDLDIATAGAYGQSNRQSKQNHSTTNGQAAHEKVKSRTSALAPPPRDNIPPVPTVNPISRTVSGASGVSPPRGGPTKSGPLPPSPLPSNSHTNHQQTQQQLTNTLTARLPQNITTSHAQNRAPSIPQTQSPAPNQSTTPRNGSLTNQSPKPSSPSQEGLKQKPSFGHRMLNGFKKGSDRERERQKAEERLKAREWDERRVVGGGNGQEARYGYVVDARSPSAGQQGGGVASGPAAGNGGGMESSKMRSRAGSVSGSGYTLT